MKNTLTKFALLASIAAFAIAWTHEDGVEKLIGKPLGKIEMKTLEGKSLTNKDFKDKVVLLDFWATWCGPCVKASPIMEKLHNEFQKKGLMVIGANAIEDDNTGKAAQSYRDEHKYTYTFTYDNDKLAESWGIKGIPTFVIIGKDGVVTKTFTGFGPTAEKEMRAEIARLLAK